MKIRDPVIKFLVWMGALAVTWASLVELLKFLLNFSL